MTTLQAIKEQDTIAKRCAAVRKNWSPVERKRRRVLANAAQDALFKGTLTGRPELKIA